ncbi:MAG: hypothetical protein Q9163_005546 [Psora crenata]
MYWPLGAPRIYAASRRKRRSQATDNEEKETAESEESDGVILDLRVARNGHLFTTITETTLTVWQTSPVVVLASITRSAQSLKSYGQNVAVLLRPDSAIAVVHTSSGFLITYSIVTDPTARVYQQIYDSGHTQKQSNVDRLVAEQESRGLSEVTVRFQMVIKVDAGIGKVLALDEELVVATEKPPAVQCIKWAPDNSGNQTSTELISRMSWMQKKSSVVEMVYDRAMSLAVWITNEGRVYAVQRMPAASTEADAPRRLFHGYGFHIPEAEDKMGSKVAINARFSLLAVACADAEVIVYTARDYAGSIRVSHRLEPPASLLATGSVTSLAYSPDGYCLFAGYQKGWALWSVYGKLQGSSFAADPKLSEKNDEGWLQGVGEACWLGTGTHILVSRRGDRHLWLMEMAKSAVTGCFSAANISRTVLLTHSTLMVYRGYDLLLSTTISADPSLWHHVEIPFAYLSNQRPIRSAVISPDGRYLAIAGRRGLAHYSISSGRWKTFEDVEVENAFVVRGGMCWYQHILIAAAETDDSHELRLYSRERGLDDSSLLSVEQLPSPVVTLSLTGQDSLLVYTYQNILYHFVVNPSPNAVALVQVGQIALNGIVRAPARVRAVSWILPEHQLREGDPSQDVACASVIFLVDAKLVLLQSSTSDMGAMKYDMRVIANNVEYFDLMRDQRPFSSSLSKSLPESPSAESALDFSYTDRGLKDSLWYFDGSAMNCWMDVEDLVQSASRENERDIPSTVVIATDFYPTSVVLNRGILLGIDADLVQRRDVNFAFFRFSVRYQLFLPPILRRHLAHFNSLAASSLARRYQQLPYFSHALEILLHTVLDDAVDKPPDSDSALLPAVISFLSTFPDYLDILVQCTRKTEVRSWPTLFNNLPSPQELFEASLEKGMLKTAGGYLLVLQTLEESERSSEQCVRLLQKAQQAEDWELCKELARFLMALDTSGDTLREAMARMNIQAPASDKDGIRPKTPRASASRLGSKTTTLVNGEQAAESNKGSPRRHASENGGKDPHHKYHSPVSLEERGAITELNDIRVMEDFNSETDSDYTSYWRDWFISSRGNEYFCEIDEDYLTDRFNLTGLNADVTHYQYALDLVTDVFDLDCDDDMREQIEKSARHLYGLVHARYITTIRGLGKMLDKYKKSDFGRCPRVLCHSQPLLPTGMSDVPQVQSVKLYCGRCEDIYNPKSSRHANIDGAYFGTSFQNILYQVYPALLPEKSIERYQPRVFGFKVHAAAALERWQTRMRGEMQDRLKEVNIDKVFKETDELADEMDEDEEDMAR